MKLYDESNDMSPFDFAVNNEKYHIKLIIQLFQNGHNLDSMSFIWTILTTASIIFLESSRRKRGNPKAYENSNKVARAYLNKGPE